MKKKNPVSSSLLFHFLVVLVAIPISISAPRAQEPVECPVDGKSLEVIDPKESQSLERLKNGVMQSACNADSLFADITDPLFQVKHNRLRCGEVELCIGEKELKSQEADAKEILKDSIPKAALLGVLIDEIKNKSDYTASLSRFEVETKSVLCPVEKIESSCEINIRNALNSVGGTLVDFPDLDRGPTSVELLPQFIANKFFANGQWINKSKLKTIKKSKRTKADFLSQCGQKISYNKICQMSKERQTKIAVCEIARSKDCLSKEQLALAALLNTHKKNKDLFLSLEKQLCTSSRIVSDTSQLGAGVSYLAAENVGVDLGIGLKMKPLVGFDSSRSRVGLRAPASAEVSETKLPKESASTNVSASSDGPSKSPSEENVVRTEAMKVEIEKPHDESESIKGFANSDGTTLSEHFSNTMTEFVKNENQAEINTDLAPNPGWSSDVTNRFNALNEEEKKKKEEEEKHRLAEISQLEEAENKKLAEGKKSDEMNALSAQINGLKARLEEMNANANGLHSKKPGASAEDKLELDKGALEREKSILDLKKKLAELEADKKKMQAESLARLEEAQSIRAKEDARRAAQNSAPSIFSNNDHPESENRDRSQSSKSYAKTSPTYSESRSPASVSGGSGASGSTAQGLVLTKVGSQATPESSVVYMTAGELKGYPYQLNDNASNGEIEKMILGNKGASIILGNSEQIIPITENGVVVLDENGKVKYKRIKISLVKNDRERKQNIAREISSLADLKREEQKQRDLIRYQEMKKAMKHVIDNK